MAGSRYITSSTHAASLVESRRLLISADYGLRKWTACLLALACLASTALILGLNRYYAYPALCLVMLLGVLATWRIHVIMHSKCHRLYKTKIR